MVFAPGVVMDEIVIDLSALDFPSLYSGGDRKNLFSDGGAHFPGEQVRLFQCFPRFGRALRRLDRDLPERTCRNPRRVGKTPHLIRRDFGEAAAVAKTQSERVAWIIG